MDAAQGRAADAISAVHVLTDSEERPVERVVSQCHAALDLMATGIDAVRPGGIQPAPDDTGANGTPF